MEMLNRNIIVLMRRLGRKILRACLGLIRTLLVIRWVSTMAMQRERASQQMIFLHSKKIALARMKAWETLLSVLITRNEVIRVLTRAIQLSIKLLIWMLIVSYCTSAAILSRLQIRFSLSKSRQQQMALSISLHLTYNRIFPCSCSCAQIKLRRLLYSSTTTFKPLPRVSRLALMVGICACNLCNRNDIIGHFSRKKHQCKALLTKNIWPSWTTSRDIRSHSRKKWWCRSPAL